MDYNHLEIENKWRKFWAENKTFKAEDASSKPKYYVLDMFPYPSGAGLHVGHPLGYIASDIVSRYKRHKGFNVLHPMGYDSFGLPAEQYAIQTGQHPAITTEQNIARYREQLDKIGFSFDWDREVRTSNPDYYKWTQWIFIQLFNSWYNPETDKAEPISTLIPKLKGFEKLSEKEQSDVLMDYRLAYLGEAYVNWCPALGTVLANDEVKDGVSERGGHPVERKLMKQWSMRITAYAERLLKGLDSIDWTDSLKESQRNWIGKSEGTSLKFKIQNSNGLIEVFTTRPDTIFGVSFLTLAPEHELVSSITTPEQKEAVEEYITKAKNRSERERQADVNTISGVFTGAYAEHPFSGKQIPIWVGDYVLAGYGTGAVMAVPAHDERDYKFAKHFGLDIPVVVSPFEGGKGDDEHTPNPSQAVSADRQEGNAYSAKEGKLINSDFLNGLEVKDAIKKAIEEIEKKNLGKGKTNFRLRDAVFGRQRYWGEPIPIYYKRVGEDLIPCAVDEKDLPIVLPEVDKYLPTEDGDPPLARAKNWSYSPPSGELEGALETTTMPGWAGSSWYFLRYMDPKNTNAFVSKQAADYWQQIDLYMGGSEHATGHLLYFRFWTKFLKDLGYISIEEPAKKLINQGMIQGRSNFVYKLKYFISNSSNSISIKDNNIPVIYLSKKYADAVTDFTSKNHESTNIRGELNQKIKELLKDKYSQDIQAYILNNIDGAIKLNVDVNIVENDELDKNAFLSDERFNTKNSYFINEDDEKYICTWEIEKMSKSKWNVVNPDDIVEKYGADTLRMYEMFLGPLEQSKPWNTNGITGVYGFLKKLWRLFENGISEEKATKDEQKILHETIKKIAWDIENFSFNTSISQFMICVNKLTELKCTKREVLEPLLICLSPYAPHICEELWQRLGHTESIEFAPFPQHNEAYLQDDSHNYPISINGKVRVNLEFPLDTPQDVIQAEVLKNEVVQKWLEGKEPKKIIVVPKRIVNIVV
jgi:leucyl-tRNA synthetase